MSIDHTAEPAGLIVQRVPLDSLAPDPSNARTHGDENLEAITASLRRFGQAEPLIVQTGTRRIIAGHGRLAAMRSLGWTEADVVELDVDDLNATALGIALNRTAELAEWDDRVLSKLLAELQANGGLDGVGYDEDQLQALIDEVADLDQGEVDEDEVPAPMDESVSQRGDIWILGDHRLMCGDSSVRDDVDALLAGARIHLVNSDPPYNVKVEPRSNNAIAAGLSSFEKTTTHHQGLDLARDPGKSTPTTAKMRPKDRPLANDFLSDEDFERLLDAWFSNFAYAMEPGASFYLWGGYANCASYPPALKANGLYFSQAIIWNKLHPVLTRKDFMGAHEWCFYGWREGAGHQFYGPNNATDLWEVKKVTPQSMVHLCMHPDALVLTDLGYRSIRTLAVGDRVFSGDGTYHAVEHVTQHEYTSEQLFRIHAKGGNLSTLASDNHPFLIWRPSRKKGAIISGEVGWIRADEVRVGDYTLTPIPAEPTSDPFPEHDEDFWFLFGLYLAQGHLQRAGHGERKYPSYSIHKKRRDLVERIFHRWPTASEYDPNDYADEPSSGLQVMAFDGDAGEEFERLGGRLAHGKRIAPEVLSLPRAKRQAVFEGWLNGDGCKVHDRSYWQGNTVSGDLAVQLCLLTESLGYRANLYAYDPPEDLGGIGDRKFKSRRRVYNLYFYAVSTTRKRGCPERLVHDGREYSLRYVKSVEQVPYQGDVWNLSVEGDPTFQTAVGLTHNTEKPVELAVRAINYSSKRGQNVLDFFGGSGSTLMGCEHTGRRGYLMEMDTAYCDVIVRRWQNATKRDAILESSGETFATTEDRRRT